MNRPGYSQAMAIMYSFSSRAEAADLVILPGKTTEPGVDAEIILVARLGFDLNSKRLAIDHFGIGFPPIDGYKLVYQDGRTCACTSMRVALIFPAGMMIMG